MRSSLVEHGALKKTGMQLAHVAEPYVAEVVTASRGTSLKRSMPVRKSGSGLRDSTRCLRASCRRSGLRLGSLTSILKRAALHSC